MSTHHVTTRRKALQVVGGLPLLPFTGAMGAASLLGCASAGSPGALAQRGPTITSVVFNPSPVPTTVVDRARVFTQASVTTRYADGSSKDQGLSYQPLYRTGDMLTQPGGGAVMAGGYFLPDGVTPIMDRSGSTPEQFYSDCPDGTSLLQLPKPQVPGVKGHTLFAVTQFEYLKVNNAGASMFGALPSPVGIATLDQDPRTGALTVVRYYNVPTAPAHGLWVTCAASLSPWNTHLGSEESEPDAWQVDNAIAGSTLTQFQAFSTYTFGQPGVARPYLYGHVPEVTVHPDGTGSVKKHYCLGRISRELVHVMPDERTVLMGDDTNGAGLFMFVADRPRDLSAGTLYAAKLVQTSAPGGADGGRFNVVQMIALGHASSAEIEVMAKRYKANDILSVSAVDPGDPSYTKINYRSTQQWLKIKPGMDKAAAFLETRRYAALLGATMELSKFEGVTVNIKDKKAYIAISVIRDTMTANGFVGDAIQLQKLTAGAVYEVVLGTNSAVGSDWVPQSMHVPPALLGQDTAPDRDGNKAVLDKIAGADNLKFSEALRTLFIGEDTSGHLNNCVWAYNVDTRKLTRMLSVPAGAECTGLHAVDNLNGFAYLMSNFQHPGEWPFTPEQTDLDAAIKALWGGKKKSAVGYISGLPRVVRV